MENTNVKNFGASFPKTTKNSGKVASRPSGEFNQAGKPKSQKDAGHSFPTQGKSSKGESSFMSERARAGKKASDDR